MERRILVVDDDRNVLTMVSEVLTYSDYRVKAIDRTPDILAQIDDFRPDVLLLDYYLYEKSGGDICHRVKSTRRTERLPVILISAYTHAITATEAAECDAILNKPFGMEELLHTVNRLIHHSV